MAINEGRLVREEEKKQTVQHERSVKCQLEYPVNPVLD